MVPGADCVEAKLPNVGLENLIVIPCLMCHKSDSRIRSINLIGKIIIRIRKLHQKARHFLSDMQSS